LLDDTTSESIKDFITVAVLYEVVLGILVGAVLGYVFAKVMHFMEKQGFIGPDSYVVQFVAMTVFIEGIVTLMGNDDLLASFAAGERACGADQPASYLTKRSTGSAISWDGHFNEQTEDNAVFASLVESKFCRYD
jgi:NhaP-type Na+/H+ or K+/H+ antiporter